MMKNLSVPASLVVWMKRWWSLFVEAVRGSERDYTVGPVGPALVMLSVPMVLEMAMESLFAVVDVFYVSRVGAEAVATVGVTESMLTIVYTVALGLGIAMTVAFSTLAVASGIIFKRGWWKTRRV